MIESSDNCFTIKKKFRVEKWWMERLEFKEIVANDWANKDIGDSSMDKWQNKIRMFRRLVRGWSTNVIAELNRHKQEVVAEFNWLDLEAEERELEEFEKARMKELSRELDKLWALCHTRF
jgi:hypothetical protein